MVDIGRQRSFRVIGLPIAVVPTLDTSPASAFFSSITANTDSCLIELSLSYSRGRLLPFLSLTFFFYFQSLVSGEPGKTHNGVDNSNILLRNSICTYQITGNARKEVGIM